MLFPSPYSDRGNSRFDVDVSSKIVLEIHLHTYIAFGL
jgi:hypothetical protein